MRRTGLILRIVLLSLPTWTLRILINVPVYLIGLLLIWAYVDDVEPQPSPKYPGRTVLQFRSTFMRAIWGNYEDGVDGLRGGDPAQNWWAEQTRDWSDSKRIFRWSALRNPANNLRYVPVLNPRFKPERIRYIGSDHEPVAGERGWFYIWQGFYSAFRFQTARRRLWIGWKFRPEDVRGVDPADTRLPLADFAIQLKRIRT